MSSNTVLLFGPFSGLWLPPSNVPSYTILATYRGVFVAVSLPPIKAPFGIGWPVVESCAVHVTLQDGFTTSSSQSPPMISAPLFGSVAKNIVVVFPIMVLPRESSGTLMIDKCFPCTNRQRDFHDVVPAWYRRVWMIDTRDQDRLPGRNRVRS